MKTKPAWGLWLTWFLVYTALDLLLSWAWHHHLGWTQLPGAGWDAFLGASLTWLFAAYRWYKAEAGL